MAKENRSSGAMSGKLLVAACLLFAAAEIRATDGWSAKFYDGLEANGKVSTLRDGYKGKSPCLEFRHIDGAQKFGAEKRVKTALEGPVEWKVAADVWCAEGGEAGVSMEFFNAKGDTISLKDGKEIKPRSWTRHEWRFAAPASATAASVHVLSLSTGPVRFANIEVESVKGRAENEIPFGGKALPMQWNSDWNGGRQEFTSFAQAPMPISFHLKGDKGAMKKPAFEIDIPDDLELLDAFTAHQASHRAEKPSRTTAISRDGIRYARLRFERANVFKIIMPVYGWERKLELLLGLKPGASKREHTVYWRLADGDRNGPESKFLMKFADLPTNLREPKDFTILSWQCDDLMFSNDAALEAAIPAYEAAGLTWFNRITGNFRRGKEIESKLEARKTGWRFAFGFADLWDPRFLKQNSEEFRKLNAKMAEFDSGKPSKRSLCPDYFNNDPEFRKHHRENVLLPGLEKAGVKTGDIVTSDFEPWGSQHYCVCERCRTAFAKHIGLAKVPTVPELKERPAEWAEFRCSQTEETLRQFFQTIREYNPGLVLCDYDYVLLYGTKHEKIFVTGCAKDTRRNEKWFDMHICSYYHTCGLKSFEAISNNTQHLDKPYMPLGAVGGYGGYLRAGEVRHPRHLRMLALAAFVHGCPGFGFYQGIHYDGEHLLAFMKARDEIAAVENFRWGKNKGTLAAESGGRQFAHATCASEDGREQIAALFNYDDAETIKVKISAPAGGKHKVLDPATGKTVAEAADCVEIEIGPEDVRFLTFRKP